MGAAATDTTVLFLIHTLASFQPNYHIFKHVYRLTILKHENLPAQPLKRAVDFSSTANDAFTAIEEWQLLLSNIVLWLA